jgi:MFS family permease
MPSEAKIEVSDVWCDIPIVDGENAETLAEKDPRQVYRPLNPRKVEHLLKVLQITWSSSTDRLNPRNWSIKRRLCIAFLLSLLSAFPSVPSTMLAPAQNLLCADLDISSPRKLQLVYSIYNLGSGFGGIFFAPLSERYGRTIVVHMGVLLFLGFNTAAGFTHTGTQMGVCRFFAGFLHSIIRSVGTSVLADTFPRNKFGIAGAIYGFAPLFGPTLGPVIGGYVASKGHWRWMCYGLSLIGVLLLTTSLLLLPETHAPTIMNRKKRRLAKKTGQADLYTVNDDKETLLQQCLRPTKMLATQNLIQFLGVYLAFLSGVCFVHEYTFPTLWTDWYGQNTAIGGLHYLAIGLGLSTGALMTSFLNDWIYKLLCIRNGGVGNASFRIPVMFIGAFLAPIGLFWYGWTAELCYHWLLPDSGVFIYSIGLVTGIVNFQTYVVDYYGTNAASAIAAVSFAQAIVGFILPLFGHSLYLKLSYGWGNTILGFIAIGTYC